jgi:all-trans-retinol dehydrogenase (NAD+)
LSEKDVERVMSVNTVGIIRTIHEFLPGMIAAKRGHIVTVSSMGGLSGVNKGVDYCASKFGAVGIDESLRYEL